MLNGNFVRTYDVTDAFYKICEFAIKCKPFEMALIPRQNFCIGGNPVFRRDVVPVNGYHRLSNGLQAMPIHGHDDLQTVTNMIKTYCQIDDNMIVFLNE
mgnify:CR=1 FL=1